MTQLSHPADPIIEQSADFIIERRRLGFWVVANGSRFFTVDFGCDRETMNPRYRVTWGSSFKDFLTIDAAFHFCRFPPRRMAR